jgi:flagellar motor switch protein FliN/FliY
MPLKVSEIIERADGIQNIIWTTAAHAASEVLNSSAAIDVNPVAALEASDMVDVGATGCLCISFSLGHQPTNLHTLIVEETHLAGFLSGVQGQLINVITEGILQDCHELFEAIVHGMCQGIGRLRGEATAPDHLTLRLTPFLAPDNLMRAQVILKSAVTLSTDAGRMEMLWIFDSDSLSGMGPEAEGDKPFSNKVHSAEVGASGSPPDDASLRLLYDIPLEISVELGRVKMIVKDVLELGAGSIVEIEKAAGEPVDVLVNGKYVARGEVVVIEDNFGVRITEILNPAERLARLGDAA